MTFTPDYDGALVHPSPNHGERIGFDHPDMILLHYTGMPGADSALDWLSREESQVSCHYFVFEDGRVLQLVPEARRAWHAGKGSWKSCTDINSCSIGIEIANDGHPGGLPDFPSVQIEAVIALCKDIIQRRNIRPERVLGHSDVARTKGDVEAFQRHFRLEQVDGIADMSTIDTLHRLLKTLPDLG